MIPRNHALEVLRNLVRNRHRRSPNEAETTAFLAHRRVSDILGPDGPTLKTDAPGWWTHGERAFTDLIEAAQDTLGKKS
jgi:hypothetical protein